MGGSQSPFWGTLEMMKGNNNFSNQAQRIQAVDSALVTHLSAETAWTYRVLPLVKSQGVLRLATAKALDPVAINDLRFILGCEFVCESWADEEIEAALHYFYPADRTNNGENGREYQVIEKSPAVPQNGKRDELADERSIIERVNGIVNAAIKQHASDIHIEPYETEVRVRFRIDGMLQKRRPLELGARNAIVSRLKIMADLDIAEKRRPQDGRIRVSDGGSAIDIRVSTLPTDFGEKVVLRILDKSVLQLELDRLGMHPQECAFFKNATLSPDGMILVTGPTGSGKTTTLYATLNHLNREGVNILTIEDPIEYNLPGINQAQMRGDIGFTFARALRTFLRQDPDIIMVGEIRDHETAEIAVRAALTGHLVLSTLHTNDAASAVMRLVDMGIEPFLLASCIRLVVAQRLVRRICTSCKQKRKLPHPSLPSHLESEWRLSTLFEGNGCEQCYYTGYGGRAALFEIMPISARLAQLITSQRAALDLKNQAIRAGMKTLPLKSQPALLQKRLHRRSHRFIEKHVVLSQQHQ